MRKSDIDYHYDNGRAVPAVNVKVHGVYRWADGAADVARELGADDREADAFAAYCARLSDDAAESLFAFACESQFELWADDMRQVYGPDARAYTAGRSGGWVYVDGITRDDVDGWDAVALGQWARVARWARDAADAVPAVMAEIEYLNRWTADRDEEARLSADLAAPDVARAVAAARKLPAVRSRLYGPDAATLAEVGA